MVLRGSKVRPESSLDDATAAVDRAKAYLAQVKREGRAERRRASQASQGSAWQRARVTVGAAAASSTSSAAAGTTATPAPASSPAATLQRQPSVAAVDTEELYHIVRVLLEKLDHLEKLDKQEEAAEMSVETARSNLENTLKQLICGGMAGCTARSCVAPIDRVKILMQTQHLTDAAKGAAAGSSGGAAAGGAPPKERYRSVGQSLRQIFQLEGVRGLWRGNGVNCIRVFPYAATQFVSYDKFKNLVTTASVGAGLGDFGVLHRLVAGSMAAVTATSLTHPLDVIRLRLSVQPELTGMASAARSIFAESG